MEEGDGSDLTALYFCPQVR